MEPLAWYRIAAPVAMVAVLGLLAAAGNPRFRFAVLGVAAMVGYAVVQDQVSARLCPEYFSLFHPPIPGLTDPTLLGITWGFLGAWWGGVLMGYTAGLTATLGSRPQLGPRDLARPLLVLFAVMSAVVFLTGYAVWRHAEMFEVSLSGADVVPADRRRSLLVVACYHFAAYGTAAAGSVLLCLWVRAERIRRARR